MALVHVPYTVDQDEDGIWCAVKMVIDEDGVPAQLARTLDLEVA